MSKRTTRSVINSNASRTIDRVAATLKEAGLSPRDVGVQMYVGPRVVKKIKKSKHMKTTAWEPVNNEQLDAP